MALTEHQGALAQCPQCLCLFGVHEPPVCTAVATLPWQLCAQAALAALLRAGGAGFFPYPTLIFRALPLRSKPHWGWQGQGSPRRRRLVWHTPCSLSTPSHPVPALGGSGTQLLPCAELNNQSAGSACP